MYRFGKKYICFGNITTLYTHTRIHECTFKSKQWIRTQIFSNLHSPRFFNFFTINFINICDFSVQQSRWADAISLIARKSWISSWRTIYRIFSTSKRAPPRSKESRECALWSLKRTFKRRLTEIRPSFTALAYPLRGPHLL